MLPWIEIKNTVAIDSQEYLKEEELLIPREQEARQKVTEMKATQDSEKSQGSVLKAIIQAKDSKEIEGIYGRLGDLGAIDGIMLTLVFSLWYVWPLFASTFCF